MLLLVKMKTTPDRWNSTGVSFQREDTKI